MIQKKFTIWDNCPTESGSNLNHCCICDMMLADQSEKQITKADLDYISDMMLAGQNTAI